MTYSKNEEQVFLFGTDEPLVEPRRVHAGNLVATIDAGALRMLCVDGIEVLRQIDFPIRDADWASLSPTVISEDIQQNAEGFRYERQFEVAEGALLCTIVYEATSAGEIFAHGEAYARRDFVTNRAGFTVLHPLRGICGEPVTVRHASGGTSEAMMPDLIQPSQPIKDIAGIIFQISGVRVDISFAGEVFEMEDQRNWSDASYKTYCRPLVEPFAYVIKAGETLKQSVHVSVAGEAPKADADIAAQPAVGEAIEGGLPKLLLAAQEGLLAEEAQLDILHQSGINHFLLRVTPDNCIGLLAALKQHLQATNGAFDLEIVLKDDEKALPQLEHVAKACAAQGLTPVHVIALPAAYLKSYQPESVWPQGLSTRESFEAASRAFKGSKIGAGMLTNFTEINRCPPDGMSCDYVTHANSATIHAADDTSVMQTLETLPDIFRSASAIAGPRSYRLGLTAIGMRTNPYGAATLPNPRQHRLTMSVWDPRARGLFGAAWAVGALATTESAGVEAIALASPVGPFGVLSTRGEVQRPWYDAHADARVYPIFHVLRALSSAHTRYAMTGLPKGFAGVAVGTSTGQRLVITNLERQARSITLPEGALCAALNIETFETAAADPLWLDKSMKPKPEGSIDLTPYMTVFCDLARE